MSRIEILELLGKGKITADEAATLLSNAAPVAEKAAPPKKTAVSTPPPTAEDGKEPNWFRVRVANLETGKNRVSVNIPVRMMKFGLKIGSRFSPEIENLDWNELSGAIKDMKTGMLIDVQDEDSNEHVQIYLD
jgi:hypothetical protein